MKPPAFWRSWPAAHRNLFYVIWSITVLALLCCGAGVFYGTELVYQWDIQQDIQPLVVPLQRFFIGLFEIVFPIENKTVTTSLIGGDIQITPWVWHAYLSLLLLSLSVILAALVKLTRWWFLIAMAGVIVFFVYLRLERLHLWNMQDQTPVYIILALVVIPNYLMHAFCENWAFLWRWLVNLAICIALTALIWLFSTESWSLLLFTNELFYGALALFLLFTFSVGHEIVSGFLTLTTRGNRGEGEGFSVGHFSIISLIYLVNLVLTYLYNTGFIHWNFIYVNAALLVSISAILGIWGHYRRRELYENMLDQPEAAMLWAGLALASGSTYAFGYFTANDALLEVLEDGVIFTHIGMGFMFYIYVLANFNALLGKNMQVYKVVYQPKYMPFFTARFAGLVTAAGLFFLGGKAAYNQAISGYYAQKADVQVVKRDPLLADEYYYQSRIYMNATHHANYALARISLRQQNADEAYTLLMDATRKNPTPQAFALLASVQSYLQTELKAGFVLNQGLIEFENNGALLLDMGAYAQQHLSGDSASTLYAKALSSNQTDLAGVNLMALAARGNVPYRPDSIWSTLPKKPLKALEVNALALANKAAYADFQPYNTWFPRDSILHPVDLAFLLNRLFHQELPFDSTDWNRLNRLIELPVNAMHNSQVQFGRAVRAYRQGDFQAAFRQLDYLAQGGGEREGYLNYLQGIIALSQHRPRVAEDFLSSSLRKGYGVAMFPFGLSFLQQGDVAKAFEVWDEGLPPRLKPAELEGLRNCRLDSVVLDEAFYTRITNDYCRYYFLTTIDHRLPIDEVLTITQLMQSETAKSFALERLIDQSLMQGKVAHAERLFREWLEINGTNNSDLVWMELKLATARNNYQKLLSLLENLEPQQPHHFAPWHYYHGLAAFVQDDSARAVGHLQRAATLNPFDTYTVLKATQTLSKLADQEFFIYNALLEASEINRYDVPLLKAYVFQAVSTGFANYAENMVNRIENLTSDRDFQDFKVTYDSLLLINQQNNEWQ